MSALALWQYDPGEDPVVQSALDWAGQVGVAVDDRQPIHLQVLLQRPFRGCVGFKLLEAQLEVPGAPKGEVLHLARCWTAERLARQGLPHPARCLLCDQLEETMTGCPFARMISLPGGLRCCAPPPVPCAKAPRRWSYSRLGGFGSTATEPSSTTLGLLSLPCLTRDQGGGTCMGWGGGAQGVRQLLP
jgi:hypothetical protein